MCVCNAVVTKRCCVNMTCTDSNDSVSHRPAVATTNTWLKVKFMQTVRFVYERSATIEIPMFIFYTPISCASVGLTFRFVFIAHHGVSRDWIETDDTRSTQKRIIKIRKRRSSETTENSIQLRSLNCALFWCLNFLFGKTAVCLYISAQYCWGERTQGSSECKFCR